MTQSTSQILDEMYTDLQQRLAAAGRNSRSADMVNTAVGIVVRNRLRTDLVDWLIADPEALVMARQAAVAAGVRISGTAHAESLLRAVQCQSDEACNNILAQVSDRVRGRLMAMYRQARQDNHRAATAPSRGRPIIGTRRLA